MANDAISKFMGAGKALRWRIVAVLLFAAMVPLAFAGFGSWIVFGRLLEQKSLEEMRTMVEGHADAIEAYLSEQLHLLQLAAESHSSRELTNVANLQTLLNNLNASSDEGFIDLGVIDADGKHLAYVGPYNLQDRNYRDADWFKEVNVRGQYISDVFPGFRQVPHCIIAVQTIENDKRWILRTTINSEKFSALVKSGILSDGSDSYIVNRDGLYQSLPKSGLLLDKAPDITPVVHTGVEDHHAEIGGVTKLLVTTWINNNRWMLVVEQDLSFIQAPVNQAIATGAYVVLIAVVFLAFITFFSTRHLTARIDKATAEREEISRAFVRSAKLASIGELTTGLAHEINNPLAIISAEQTNISDILKDSNCTKEDIYDALDSIKRCQTQVQRCAGITKKLLQFGRSQESKLELTDVKPRLIDIVSLMHRHAKVRNINLHEDIGENLPRVLLDPVELEQVLVNLINNSVDAMPTGGEIVVGAHRVNESIVINVSDNGTGISPADLDRIFEPFFTTKPVGKGTGLGLSVCYGIVQGWGGTIEASSKQGQGTTMKIILPYQTENRKA
ncbi:MAG: ATP-binding protein [Candidatus Zixiibacteriota bacterium]